MNAWNKTPASCEGSSQSRDQVNGHPMTTKPVTDAEVIRFQNLQSLAGLEDALDDLLQSRAVEVVGSVPVTGIFHARRNPPEEDWIEWPDGYEPVDGTKLYTAPPSTAPKAQSKFSDIVSDGGMDPRDRASQPKAPAPVLVAQGEEPYDWEAEALLQRERIIRIAKALRPDMGSFVFEDVIQAVEKILIARRATTPGGAGGDVVAEHPGDFSYAVRTAIKNAGLTLVKTGHGYQLRKFGEITGYTATPAAEQANPDHLGSGASGGVQGATDTERLDYLQQRGATVSIVQGDGSGFAFLVGGLHASVNPDVRAAIDAALSSTVGGGE